MKSTQYHRSFDDTGCKAHPVRKPDVAYASSALYGHRARDSSAMNHTPSWRQCQGRDNKVRPVMLLPVPARERARADSAAAARSHDSYSYRTSFLTKNSVYKVVCGFSLYIRTSWYGGRGIVSSLHRLACAYTRDSRYARSPSHWLTLFCLIPLRLLAARVRCRTGRFPPPWDSVVSGPLRRPPPRVWSRWQS